MSVTGYGTDKGWEGERLIKKWKQAESERERYRDREKGKGKDAGLRGIHKENKTD